MNNRKSTIRFSVDFENRQIVATNATLKKAQRYGSKEYKELCKLSKAHPQFDVVAKEIEKNETKRTYLGLDYAFIEKYISIQSDANSII